MVHNHRQQPPPRGRGSGIPVRGMASRRPGLRSGGLPPEPGLEGQPPQMTIRFPAMVNARGAPTTASTAVRGDIPESNPPGYTERVGPEPVAIPGLDEDSSNPDPDQTRVVHPEERPSQGDQS